MKFSELLLRFFCVSLFFVGLLPTASAAYVVTGNVEPTDPSTWTASTDCYIGNTSDGSLKVNSGDNLLSGATVIGHKTDVSGEVTVCGSGTWTTSGYLNVGMLGNGVLNIQEGASVINPGCCVGEYSGATGVVNVDGIGSTWTNTHEIFVGFSGGTGTLNITGGATVVCNTSIEYSSTLGGYAGKGVATIKGAGSTWTNSGIITIGNPDSQGTLNILDGGTVSNTTCYMGWGYLSNIVTVNGGNSKWINSGDLCVGIGGYGGSTVNITGAGTVTAVNVSVYSKSILALDIGTGSKLTVGDGTGTFTNNGTVRFSAGASAVGGKIYTPISAGTWTDTAGTYKAIGGTWNADHTFTAANVQSGNSGTSVTLTTARVLIEDSKTGWSVGASFAADSIPTSFKATVLSDDISNLLKNKLAAGDLIRSGWTFEAGGYTEGDPVYLSFKVGKSLSLDDLDLWHYSGGEWSTYTADDLTYDGTYASFTVTGFSGYAVTVPEPGAVILLVIAMGSLLVYAWRKQRS